MWEILFWIGIGGAVVGVLVIAFIVYAFADWMKRGSH